MVNIYRHSNDGFGFSLQDHKPELLGVYGCHVFVHTVDLYLLSGSKYEFRKRQPLHKKALCEKTPAFVRNVFVSIKNGNPCFDSITEDIPYMAWMLADLSIPLENAKFCESMGISPEFSIEAIVI